MKNDQNLNQLEGLMSSKRNPMRVFSHILKDWDMDLHLHTNWSIDNPRGPNMQDYIPIAEKHRMHIGFADHFEFLYYDTGDQRYGPWKLNPNTVDAYLEEVDRARERYPRLTSGLEIDFYPQRLCQLQDFCDKYRKDFDFLIGSVHEIQDFYPITLRPQFTELIEKQGLPQIITKYFQLERDLVQSDIFDAIAHPDVVFRFLPPEVAEEFPDAVNNTPTIELGQLCIQHNLLMEVNTSGLRYEWHQTLPNEVVVNHLLAQGVQFFVGSDSHSLQDFENSILILRIVNNWIRKRR